MRAKLLGEFVAVEHPQDWRFRDITGNVYGRLTVDSYAGQSKPNASHKWNCLCRCGNRVAIASGSLKNGTTKSCGCLHKETTLDIFTTHGESSRSAGTVTPEYRSYSCAKGRCTNSTDHAFNDYGGRGIEFRFASYEHFIDILGRRPTLKHSLDRIDVNGHYEPGNVRWATQREQMRNTRSNRLIKIGGIAKCQVEWADIYGISTKRIDGRRRRGWCDVCAVTLPLLPLGRKGAGCPHKAAT